MTCFRRVVEFDVVRVALSGEGEGKEEEMNLRLIFVLLFTNYAACFYLNMMARGDMGGIGQSMSRKGGPSSSTSKRRHSAYPDSGSSGVRLNKCLSQLSRRGADEAIAEGRVTVNDVQVTSAGLRVQRGDVVKLDGKKQHWMGKATAQKYIPAKSRDDRKLVYVKYYKPRGVTSTSDPNDVSNIITAGRFELFPQRLFTVGRLDKDSTGLILLTSDGRVNNALLSPGSKKQKKYDVMLDKRMSDEHMETLRKGVVITTPVQRESGRSRQMTAKTLPCEIVRSRPKDGSCTRLQFTLVEGRNRQIRRMCEALGYDVVVLHRTEFAGIKLKGIGENEWSELDEDEMKVIISAIRRGKTD